MSFLDWLNGKKTAIGALLQLLSDGSVALIAWSPALQDAIVATLPNAAPRVALVFAVITKGFLMVGVAHRFYKGFFGTTSK